MLPKITNTQAMQPTKKPHIRAKSQLQKPPMLTNPSTIDKNEPLFLIDNIKEDILSLSNDSPFRQNLLRVRSNQLASSFSFSQDEVENEYEKLLFAKFLESKESQFISFMHEFNKIGLANLVSCVKIGQQETAIWRNRVLSHYIGIWLISMGYQEMETRRRVIMNVRYLFPNEEESVQQIAGIMFDTMFQGYLPENIQLRFLIETCKRGWEYLSFFIGNFIKIIKQYREDRSQLFLQELHNLF